MGERDVVIVNNPCQLATLATPFVRAYYSESVPSSLRTLLPANTGFRLTRATERTLVAEADESTASQHLMGCDDLGPVHACYGMQAMNNILPSRPTWEKGQRVVRKGFVTEVLEISPKGEPRKIAFHLDQDPESPQMLWLSFDWATLKYQRFALPAIGESANLPGPNLRSKRR